MRIGIDARFYGPIGKGLGRYTQEVVDNLLKLDRHNHYVIFLGAANFNELVLDPEEQGRVEKILVKARWYSLAEQLEMPWRILKARLDLMHFMHFNAAAFCPVRFVVTVHDLILLKFPTVRATTLASWLYWLKHYAYRLIIWSALKRARQIITVSQYTKSDLIKTFHLKAENIAVTYEGVANLAKGRDSLFVKKIDDETTLLSYNINKPFLLYVGNAYPHKNLSALIKAFAQITKSSPEMRLVLVGKLDYFYQRLQAEAKDWPQVIFPGYVPDQVLEILYRGAVAYVFPSLYEGFGLPPLEAMAKDCPVVSSDRSALPEILGQAALYFNPEDQTAIVTALEKICTDQNLRQELIAKGRAQIKQYSWWECASQTWQVYQKLLWANGGQVGNN